MTFEEWWKSKKTLIETVVNNNKSHIDLIVFIKSIMNIAWDTSQPKWTLCKDGMPTEDGNYLWLHADKSIHVDYYWTNLKLMSYVIAWMPLPEVSDVHND